MTLSLALSSAGRDAGSKAGGSRVRGEEGGPGGEELKNLRGEEQGTSIYDVRAGGGRVHWKGTVFIGYCYYLGTRAK